MRKLLILILIVVFHSEALPQDRKINEVQKIFIKIEDGLNNGNTDKFSNYFGDKTYLSLSNSVSGYYSQNQAFYILKDFFSVNKPIGFKISNQIIEGNSPFASGTLKYVTKGIRTSASVFISLKQINSDWVVTQITIN
ncbi:MAG: DUF4783 domain-containing protein [Melioribacteraceae bacterium]|nr:DUF4783 domain-containing protein [Melioribacteraceae bacterium]